MTLSRPVYENESGSDSESDDEFKSTIAKRKEGNKLQLPEIVASTSDAHTTQDDTPIPEEAIKSDRRLQRLMNRTKLSEQKDTDDADDEIRNRRNRIISEPQVLAIGSEDKGRRRPVDSSDDEKDEDEETVERRHAALRKVKPEKEEEELLGKEDDGSGADDEDDSEYDDEYTDSSEEDSMPRLKPVFVSKSERVTVKEREIQEKKEREAEMRAKKEAEERRRQTLKMIEDDTRREDKEREEEKENEMLQAAIDAVDTGDEEEETSYELWKLRELKRVKREKDEREALMKENEEKERLRGMTEEERQQELEKNPKIVTNQAEKGKYRYMQKYYHRGAFYLDEDQDIFKRNVAEPTLEDHFDKTILPKVMQVKNFGLAGRTKYTHLVDQDTSVFDSPWLQENPQTSKFVQQSGGTKPIFERPSKKRKTT